MTTISGAGRDTVLYIHALAGAMACARSNAPVLLDLRGVNEASPSAQRAAVTELMNQTLADLETMIRSKKVPPPRTSPAVIARKVIELHENYDAVERTYTPGVGFRTLIEGLAIDEETAGEAIIRRLNPDY
ncbi:hypothetical protein [Mycolicibacterium sp.]|uniref:hypothetical protein n=1 Tax=Mycolicibacterium sp. TaxID=2320850 RepID=UPI0035600472